MLKTNYVTSKMNGKLNKCLKPKEIAKMRSVRPPYRRTTANVYCATCSNLILTRILRADATACWPSLHSVKDHNYKYSTPMQTVQVRSVDSDASGSQKRCLFIGEPKLL